jgi:WD40 repeat protein
MKFTAPYRICVLIAPLFAMTAIAARAQGSGPLLTAGHDNPDAVAVVVGIAHYHNADIAPVEFAGQDAAAIKELLTGTFGFPASRVLLLEDESASLASLRPMIRQELASLVKPGRTDLFVYYSGHGAPNVDTHEAFLLPWDYNPRFAPDRDSAYPLKELFEDLKRLNARTTTVVLDACFSGQSESGAVLKDASPAYVELSMPSGVLPSGVVITAGGSNEVATWYRERGHGLLTYYVLRGLKGEADPEGRGNVTVESLRHYLDAKVPAKAQQLRNRKQMPQVITGLGAESLLVRLSRPPALESEPTETIAAPIVARPATRVRPGSPDAGAWVEVRTLSGHQNGVSSVAFSPDGHMLASGSGDGAVKLWDVASGKELYTLIGYQFAVLSVAFSPDGRTIASAGRNASIELWDVASGKELHTLGGHTNWVSSVAFSPDGRTLASASYDSTIKLWDAASGEVLFTLTGHSGRVDSVTFSPDGRMLASGSLDATVKLWDVGGLKEVRTLSGNNVSVSSVAFSPDGRTLASGSLDHTIRLWDVASGKELRSLSGHQNAVRSVAFSPDGRRLASASDDQTIKLWDVASGKELRTLSGHGQYVSSIVFSPDGRTLAVGLDGGTVRLWQANGSN